MSGVRTRPLEEASWPDFAQLVERHNGVWGGCWCMAFHEEGFERGTTAEQNRANKERRVRAGRAHAALVYDGDACVGWCQFGAPAELPSTPGSSASSCRPLSASPRRGRAARA